MTCTVYYCSDLQAYRYEVATPTGTHAVTLQTTQHTYISPIMASLFQAGWPPAAVKAWSEAYMRVCRDLTQKG